MKWFRFYNEAAHDSKVQLLDPPQFKDWVNLLCMASEHDPRGFLPTFKQIAYVLRTSTADAEARVGILVRDGLFDVTPDGNICPHNWDERQPESDDAAGRMRKIRAEEKARKRAEDSARKRAEKKARSEQCPAPCEGQDRTCSEHVPNMFGVEEIRGDKNRAKQAAGVRGSHEECVGLSLELFDVSVANAVAKSQALLAAKLEDADGAPNWAAFAAALAEVDRRRRSDRGKKIDDVIAYAVTVAAEYIVNGIPPAPVAVEPVKAPPRPAVKPWVRPNVND